MADFYELQAEVLEARKAPAVNDKPERKPKPVDAETGYLIFASNRTFPGWTIPSVVRGPFGNAAIARQHADQLSDVWEHRTIVKFDLPARE